MDTLRHIRFKGWLAWLFALAMVLSLLPMAISTAADAAELPGSSEASAIWVDQGRADANKTINGQIWVDRAKGGGATLTSTYESAYDQLIGGVDLFYQWTDQDGAVSPIYKTISKADGSFANVVPDYTDGVG